MRRPVRQQLLMTLSGASRGNAPASPRGLRVGFTVVELLVVIAVIALLISVLMPAVGRARDQTRLTLCQSRLRSIGAASLMYASVNSSFLPVEPTLSNPHRGLIDALSEGRYLDEPRVFYCPSTTSAELEYSEQNLAAGFISYFYFSCREATPDYRVSTFLRWAIDWPRLIRDSSDPLTWVISDAWFSGEPTAHRHFKKGVNYFTLDGSVHLVQRTPRGEFK